MTQQSAAPGNPLGDNLTRVLFVHAHPDDETLATGGTIARLVGEGVRVGVLTATRGERGEFVPGSLSGRPPGELVPVRLQEVAGALRELGVGDHYWLGTAPALAAGRPPRVYQDSGMQWDAQGVAVPADDVPAEALTAAPIAEPVGDLLALLRRLRPDLVISYESTGGYRHPDHVRVHEITLAGCTAAAIPFAQVLPPGLAGPGDLAVDVTAQRARLLSALRCYRTQLEQVADDHVVHVGGQRQELPPVEYFRPVPAAS